MLLIYYDPNPKSNPNLKNAIYRVIVVQDNVLSHKSTSAGMERYILPWYLYAFNLLQKKKKRKRKKDMCAWTVFCVSQMCKKAAISFYFSIFWKCQYRTMIFSTAEGVYCTQCRSRTRPCTCSIIRDRLLEYIRMQRNGNGWNKIRFPSSRWKNFHLYRRERNSGVFFKMVFINDNQAIT